MPGPSRGKVSDLDAGNGYLTVTNPANQTTQTFKVISDTVIVTADGKPSQLLNLIEGRSSPWMLIRVTESSLPKSPSCLMLRSRLDGRGLEIGGARLFRQRS